MGTVNRYGEVIMEFRENVAIADLTTMRLGGSASYVVEVCSLQDIVEAYRFAADEELPTYILGGGSNVIGRDEGFSGVVLLNRLLGIEVVSEGEEGITIRIAGGEQLDSLAEFTAQRGWYGAEALSAIPGTIGGAVMQNAGAYGQEIGDVLISVEVYDIIDRQTIVLEKDQLDLSYRHSIFNSSAKGRYFILSATIRVYTRPAREELFGSLQNYLNEQGIVDRSPTTIRDAVTAIRAKKLPDPDKEASSGSFFKNVVLSEADLAEVRQKLEGAPIFQTGQSWKLASGWLIEQCGFKGQLLHGVRVSDQSALILINESAQSYGDLAAARAEIVAAVRERFGFILEQEPEEL
jgi:UDP-N-acetylmuramate dehydrogenase